MITISIDEIAYLLSGFSTEHSNKESVTKEKKETVNKDKDLGLEVALSLESKGINYLIIDKLAKINPLSTFYLILKETAIILDKKYKDNHIKDCRYIWTINYVTKKPEKYYNESNLYKILPLFRTKEDAYKAMSLNWIKDLLSKLQ